MPKAFSIPSDAIHLFVKQGKTDHMAILEDPVVEEKLLDWKNNNNSSASNGATASTIAAMPTLMLELVACETTPVEIRWSSTLQKDKVAAGTIRFRNLEAEGRGGKRTRRQAPQFQFAPPPPVAKTKPKRKRTTNANKSNANKPNTKRLEPHVKEKKARAQKSGTAATVNTIEALKGPMIKMVVFVESLSSEDVEYLKDMLQQLDSLDGVNLQVLTKTRIGIVVSKFKKHAEIGWKAKALLKKWKAAVKEETTAAAAAAAGETAAMAKTIPVPVPTSIHSSIITTDFENPERLSSKRLLSKGFETAPAEGVRTDEKSKGSSSTTSSENMSQHKFNNRKEKRIAMDSHGTQYKSVIDDNYNCRDDEDFDSSDDEAVMHRMKRNQERRMSFRSVTSSVTTKSLKINRDTTMGSKKRPITDGTSSQQKQRKSQQLAGEPSSQENQIDCYQTQTQTKRQKDSYHTDNSTIDTEETNLVRTQKKKMKKRLREVRQRELKSSTRQKKTKKKRLRQLHRWESTQYGTLYESSDNSNDAFSTEASSKTSGRNRSRDKNSSQSRERNPKRRRTIPSDSEHDNVSGASSVPSENGQTNTANWMKMKQRLLSNAV